MLWYSLRGRDIAYAPPTGSAPRRARSAPPRRSQNGQAPSPSAHGPSTRPSGTYRRARRAGSQWRALGRCVAAYRARGRTAPIGSAACPPAPRDQKRRARRRTREGAWPRSRTPPYTRSWMRSPQAWKMALVGVAAAMRHHVVIVTDPAAHRCPRRARARYGEAAGARREARPETLPALPATLRRLLGARGAGRAESGVCIVRRLSSPRSSSVQVAVRNDGSSWAPWLGQPSALRCQRSTSSPSPATSARRHDSIATTRRRPTHRGDKLAHAPMPPLRPHGHEGTLGHCPQRFEHCVVDVDGLHAGRGGGLCGRGKHVR